MFRKSVFIVLFACLLAACPVALANYPWDNQLDWTIAETGDSSCANWTTITSWTGHGNPLTDYNLPGPNIYCTILPSPPGPRICGDTKAEMVAMNPWDPTSWGGRDCNLTLTATAGDVNFGACLLIAGGTGADYDWRTGGRAIVEVYGGTLRTPNPPPDNALLTGIVIGGSGAGYSNAYGLLEIYAGDVNVTKLNMIYGDVNLYGGTLMVNGGPQTGTTDSNFILNQSRPTNRIMMNGGTFIVVGDHTADFNALIANGRIVSDRGTIGAPYTYTQDGKAWTAITSTGNLKAAWNPQPANNAINVHYSNDPNTSGAGTTNSVVLSWNSGDYLDPDGNDVNVTHNIYFGTSTASLTLQGSRHDSSGDPCSWTVTGPFTVGTTYYWKVDEVNDVTAVVTPSNIWKFTLHDGKAYNPRPRNLQSGLTEPLSLSWTAGDWASVQYVYFGTSYNNCNNATSSSTNGTYRGTVSVVGPNSTYPLSRLQEVGGNLPGASWTLKNGITYYWRVDDVNGSTTWKGTPWSFTPAASISIDDFEDYNSTDDINAAWTMNTTINCSGNSNTANGRLTYVADATGKHGNFYYNDSPSSGNQKAYSEVNRVYTGGTVFSGSSVFSPQPAVLRVDYIGASSNVVDSTYDRMYVALEDTAGHVGVYFNPDSTAAQANAWTQWYIALNDPNFATVSKTAVNGFFLGFGQRCSTYNHSTGNDGNVMFDNIGLWAQTCNPSVTLSADMDGDCDVDINDLSIFANDWLQKAELRTFAITAPRTPVLWYKFDDGAGTDVIDYGTTTSYTGTVTNLSALSWDASSGRSSSHLGCVTLIPNAHTYIAAPTSALSFMTDGSHSSDGGGISFSIWINADLSAASEMQTQWGGLISTWDSANVNETLELHCPSNLSQTPTQGVMNFIKRVPTEAHDVGGVGGNPVNGAYVQYYTSRSDFGTRWNHWVFIKDPTQMQVYCNGKLIGDCNGNDWASVANQPLFPPAVGDFHIGTRKDGQYGWGYWNGKMQDFQVYDYALSAAEVAYLATDGSGQILIPLTTKANLKSTGLAKDQVIDFADFAVMGNEWHQIQLWP